LFFNMVNKKISNNSGLNCCQRWVKVPLHNGRERSCRRSVMLHLQSQRDALYLLFMSSCRC
jgi:hypothetical protein